MKRLLFVGSAALSLWAMLAVSAPVWAHVVVSPEELATGDYETLTVSVPTEKEVPTTEIRLEVPKGFLLSGVQRVPGCAVMAVVPVLDSRFVEGGLLWGRMRST